jgi:hypothetical protein
VRDAGRDICPIVDTTANPDFVVWVVEKLVEMGGEETIA